MPSPHNIFLAGFMGSGKTTLGKKLALLLNREFIDLDHYIENKVEKTIAEIFEEHGEQEFRNLEKFYLDELINNKMKSIIALGGGTICFFDNLFKIKKNGLLIYIELPAIELSKRTQNSNTSRPLLQNLSNEALISTIEDKLKVRLPFYEQSHLIINGLNLTAQMLQHNIIEYQKKNNS